MPRTSTQCVTYPKRHLNSWGSYPINNVKEKKTKQEGYVGFVSSRKDILGCIKAIAGPLLVFSIAAYSAQCVMWTGDFITPCWFLSLSLLLYSSCSQLLRK